MKKTMIFYKPEYADLAIKLRDDFRAHDHEADIVSEEEHDDIEYAEKMQYGEAVFIEDSDTVTIHIEVVCQLSNQGKRPDSYVKLEVDAEDYYRIKNEG